MQFETHGSASLRTVVSNSGAVLSSGNILGLAPEQLGFFKELKNGNPSPAQSAPTYKTAPKFKIGKGVASYPAQEYLGANQSKFPWLTNELDGKNIIKWEGTKADNTSSTDIYTLGYDGVDASKRLTGILDHRALTIRLRLWGNPILKLTGRSMEHIREYVIDKGCLDACKDICADDLTLADEYIADQLLKQFNKDKFNVIPISRFVKATKIKKCNPASAAIGGLIESTKYTVSFCDDGTYSSLGAIQTQYPGYKVERDSRNGSISTYSMWRLTTAGAPTDFTNTVPVSLAVCSVCPSGYTLVAPQKTFLIERPVGTSDVSSPSAQQTFANSIGTQYGNDGVVSSVTVTNPGDNTVAGLYTSAPTATISGGGGTGATATSVLTTTSGIKSITINTAGTTYTNGTHPIVFTGGGGTGAAGTATVAGGIFTAMTITNVGSGYTSVPTITVPAAGAGSGTAAFTAVRGYRVASVTVTAPGSGFTGVPTIAFTSGGGTGAAATVVTNGAPIVISSKFSSVVSGVAKVLVTTSATTNNIVGENSDNAILQDTSAAICTPPAGSTVAWTSVKTRKVAPKTWQLTLADTVCGTSRLAEIALAYPDLVIAEEGSVGICARVYTATNYSAPIEDETCDVSEYVFTQPEAFLFNTSWKPYVSGSILSTPTCDETEPDAVCCAVGVKFEAAAFSQTTSACSYGYHAFDITDVDPVYIDLTVHTHDWTVGPCYVTDQIVTKLRGASFATGSGRLLQESERQTLMYDGKFWSTNQAINDAYGFYLAAQPNVWYDTYRLTVKIPQLNSYVTGDDTLIRQITYQFAFPTGKGKTFEALINNYVLSLDNPDLTAVTL